MVPLVANGTIGGNTDINGKDGITNGTIGGNIGTNGNTNGTIGRTLNIIGLPLVEP